MSSSMILSTKPTAEKDLDEFVITLKTQIEIFVNRMKSNSSRGRPISNDSSVQNLFQNAIAMHSKLLRLLKEQEDSRIHFEELQDKITQVKDARAALDALREEEKERLRREAEQAERLRQIQMREKLELMRKKKQEYLQYQRQVALQRMQEQERDLYLRHEQAKLQYSMQQQPPMYESPVPMMPPQFHQQPYLPPGGQYGPAPTGQMPLMSMQQGMPSDPSRYPLQAPAPNAFHMQSLNMALPNYPGYVPQQLPSAVQHQPQGLAPSGQSSMPLQQQQPQYQPTAQELIFFD